MNGTVIAFPNATLRLDKADADFWLSDAKMKAEPKYSQCFFPGAMSSVNLYVAAGKGLSGAPVNYTSLN